MILFGYEITFRKLPPPIPRFQCVVALRRNDGTLVQPRPVWFKATLLDGTHEIYVQHDGPQEVWKVCQHDLKAVIGTDVAVPLRQWGFAEDKHVLVGGPLTPFEEEWVKVAVSLGGFSLS